MADQNLTVRGAIVNLCNTCIGIGILAKPFALAVVGWYGLIAFVVASAFVTYAGICLSDVARDSMSDTKQSKSVMKSKDYHLLQDDNASPIQALSTPPRSKSRFLSKQSRRKKSRKKTAFQMVSHRALGPYGEVYAVIGFFILGWTVSTTVIIMIFELLQQITAQITDSEIDSSVLFFAAFILYTPAPLVLNWKQLTFISWIGMLSVLVILITLITLSGMAWFDFHGPPSSELLRNRIMENHEIDINSSDLSGNARDAMSIPEQVAFSLVVFMTGIAGNAAIPAISASLKNKNDIICVAATSYTMVSILYVMIACIGYWLYGEYTDVMIINDFFLWPRGPVISVISGLMIVNLWASLFIMISLVCDIIESLLGIELEQHLPRRLLRAVLLVVIVVVAYFVRKELAFVVAVSGVVGVLCSLALTMPILMYITTFWNHPDRPLSCVSKLCHVCFLMISIAVGVYSGYTSFSKLL